MVRAIFVVAFALWGAVVSAQDDFDGVRVNVLTWRQAAMSSAAETEQDWGGQLYVDGPIALPWNVPVRASLQLDIAALPGAQFDLSDSATFSDTVEVRGTLGWQLGRLLTSGQDVRTLLVVMGGVDTAIEGELDRPYLRYGAVGIRLEEYISDSRLDLLVGRRGAVGSYEWALVVSGQLAIPGADAIVFGGNVVLTLGGGFRPDGHRLTVGISVPKVVDAVVRR